jgi:HEAT repeat protein
MVGIGIPSQDNAGQAYFYSAVKKEQLLDLAVVYYLIYGIFGAVGSASGGIFLDTVIELGASDFAAYRLLFISVLLVSLFAMITAIKLDAPDSATVWESLGVMFSMRDIKAIGLLEQLEKSHSPVDEIHLIKEIGGITQRSSQRSKASVVERELLPYLSSPRFDVRVEALLALENLNNLTGKAKKALLLEMENNQYTTAYIAARILGSVQCEEAIPLLRKALYSGDYMLQGNAVLALADMKDFESLETIYTLFQNSRNPRFIASAAWAIEQFGQMASIPVLVSVLKYKETPSFVLDEIVLAIAGILDGLNDFYKLYSGFFHTPSKTMNRLLEALDEPVIQQKMNLQQIAICKESLITFVEKGSNGVFIAKIIIANSGFIEPESAIVLAEAAIDEDLLSHAGFRFFLAACAVDALINSKAKMCNLFLPLS